MENIEIKFQVKRIRHSGESNFIILDVNKFEHPNDKQIISKTFYTVKGFSLKEIHKGDILKAKGVWINNKNFGLQFEFKEIKLEIPESIESLQKFLIKRVKYIGKKRAQLLTDTFGLELLDVIIDEPNKLLEVEDIADAIIIELNKELAVIKAFDRTLKSFSWLTWSEVDKLLHEYGNFILFDFKENPYIPVDILSFERSDLSASKLEFKKDNIQRIERAILEVLKYELKDGHTYSYNKIIFDGTQKLLNKSKYFNPFKLSKEQLKDAIQGLKENKKIAIEEDRIYLKFYNNMENKIVGKLKTILNLEMETSKESSIKRTIENQDSKIVTINKKQKNAIIRAMRNKISILTGSPGTGKTHTIGALINTIKKLEPNNEIVLTAPTGKAANHMRKISGVKSYTIHNLLRIDDEKTTKFKKIDADYLIVDEASMIDIYLFYALLSSIQNHTKILLVGDYNQLPSIGPGLILKHLIESKVIPTTKLEMIHRQDKHSQIIKNAYNIINGNLEIIEDNSKGDFFFLDRQDEQDIEIAIMLSIHRLLENGYKLDDIQVVTPMNKTNLGVDRLNEKIQRIYNKNNQYLRIGERKVKLHDKVIHTINNPNIGVFNGEKGKVIEINNLNKEVIVDFGYKEVKYTSHILAELELAYSLSVHKIQGTESPIVIMPLTKKHERMHTRSLIYTSLTRAEEKFLFIGDRSQYNKAILNNDDLIRRSKIKEKLIS